MARAKTGGRVAGTPNRKTKDQINRAERILRLIENKYFEKDIAKISAAQRMLLYTSMLEYVAPKLSRQEVNATGELSIIWNEQKNYDPKQKADKGA